MPYFERKPYDARNAAGAATSPVDPILTIADQILASETSQAEPVYGPFRCARTCAPGSQESLTLSISSHEETVELTFQPENLRGPGGTQISAAEITITPASVELVDGLEVDIRVTLSPPPEAAPGLYSGRITVHGCQPSIFRVEFEVAEPN